MTEISDSSLIGLDVWLVELNPYCYPTLHHGKIKRVFDAHEGDSRVAEVQWYIHNTYVPSWLNVKKIDILALSPSAAIDNYLRDIREQLELQAAQAEENINNTEG